jgi:hypothetical protein
MWWRYQITKMKKEKSKKAKLKDSPPIEDMLTIKTQTFC